MEIPKTIDAKQIEDKWYQFWIQNHFFKSTPNNKKPYTIVMPPPNVTGVLHMGHMLNNTIQDVLIRKARMEGYNACWVPGTDHASIATESKVLAHLKEQGFTKENISRETFLESAWEWNKKYGGIILQQLKKLGASCDWDRTAFTMDADKSEAVFDAFIHLYNKGLIYKGTRVVNWDPEGLTAISDEEVIYKETSSNLIYLKYVIENTTDFITVATTRPETIMGDVAVCVNPNDEKYAHLKNKFVIIPLINKRIPIIFDEYVDKNFGSGALKVTPAHDVNDYELGKKHNLETIDILTKEGKISNQSPIYVGMDRFECRKKISKELEAKGLLVKVEQIKNKVGYSERTNAVIEPRISMQWYVKMEQLSKPALNNVLNNNINLIPDKFINTYKHWMGNVKDWCISRQLWWGQQIPAWYDNKGNIAVCKTKQEAIAQLKKQNNTVTENDIKQDDDVLDTWFSSWLWPITVFDSKVIQTQKPNAELQYYYPTNDLVTAPEILFFWVARMIISGFEWVNAKPFTNVYLTGIVRDKLGRKMSKSLGNSPDPLDLINQYSADGVRVGMLLCSPAGNDLMFDEKYCMQGRNFANKVWNSFRLMEGFSLENKAQPNINKQATIWFENRLNEQLELINDLYKKYKMSEALMATYKLVWDDFCAWYLEIIKPEFIDGKAKTLDAETHAKTIYFFESILKLMHPWMPFITEEIWHLIKQRNTNESLIISEWPHVSAYNTQLLKEFELTKEIITTVRNIKTQNQILVKTQIGLYNIKNAPIKQFEEVIIKFNNLSSIQNNSQITTESGLSFMVDTYQFFIPHKSEVLDNKAKLKLEEDLKYFQEFLKTLEAKLNNPKFTEKANEKVIALEQKKLQDTLEKINTLEQQLIKLN